MSSPQAPPPPPSPPKPDPTDSAGNTPAAPDQPTRKKSRLQWDEENLQHNAAEMERAGPRIKIDEPKTPFMGSENGSSTSGSAHQSPPESPSFIPHNRLVGFGALEQRIRRNSIGNVSDGASSTGSAGRSVHIDDNLQASAGSSPRSRELFAARRRAHYRNEAREWVGAHESDDSHDDESDDSPNNESHNPDEKWTTSDQTDTPNNEPRDNHDCLHQPQHQNGAASPITNEIAQIPAQQTPPAPNGHAQPSSPTPYEPAHENGSRPSTPAEPERPDKAVNGFGSPPHTDD